MIDKAASPFNWRSAVTIEGRRYVVPVLGGTRVRYTEPWMTRLLTGLLDRPGTFLDVGANLGQTMLKLCALDPDRTYIGFEPNPVCVSYLLRLIRLNQLEKCSIFPAGISTEPGFLPLALYDGETDSSASLVPGFRRRSGAMLNVAVVSERLLSLPDDVAVIKIDVEGGELGVIEGLMATIRRARPIIVAEVLPPKGQLERLARQQRLQTLLKSEGYRIAQVDKTTATAVPVDAIAENRTMAEVDFVFSPG